MTKHYQSHGPKRVHAHTAGADITLCGRTSTLSVAYGPHGPASSEAPTCRACMAIINREDHRQTRVVR